MNEIFKLVPIDGDCVYVHAPGDICLMIPRETFKKYPRVKQMENFYKKLKINKLDVFKYIYTNPASKCMAISGIDTSSMRG